MESITDILVHSTAITNFQILEEISIKEESLEETSLDQELFVMDYAVIYFVKDETHSEIPVNWISTNRKFCLWPDVKNVGPLISKCVPPKDSWKKYEIKIYCYCNSLEKARKKAEEANYTSICSESRIAKRKQPPQKYVPGTSDSDEEISTSPPPKFHKTNTNKSAPVQVETFADVINDDQNSLSSNIESTTVPTSSSGTIIDGNKHADIDKILHLCTEIHNYVQSIDRRLHNLEKSCANKNVSVSYNSDYLKNIVPVQTIDELNELEVHLQDCANKDSFIFLIKNIGGRHSRSCVHRILKYVFSNNFGIHCSWLGQRNNIRICDRKITNIIKDVVMATYSIKVSEFEQYCSEWFRLSKLRLQREMNKSS